MVRTGIRLLREHASFLIILYCAKKTGVFSFFSPVFLRALKYVYHMMYHTK